MQHRQKYAHAHFPQAWVGRTQTAKGRRTRGGGFPTLLGQVPWGEGEGGKQGLVREEGERCWWSQMAVRAAGAAEAHGREGGWGRTCSAPRPLLEAPCWAADPPSAAQGSIRACGAGAPASPVWPPPLLIRVLPHTPSLLPDPWAWAPWGCPPLRGASGLSLCSGQELVLPPRPSALLLGWEGAAQASSTQAPAPTPLGPRNPSVPLESLPRGSSVASGVKVLGCHRPGHWWAEGEHGQEFPYPFFSEQPLLGPRRRSCTAGCEEGPGPRLGLRGSGPAGSPGLPLSPGGPGACAQGP